MNSSHQIISYAVLCLITQYFIDSILFPYTTLFRSRVEVTNAVAPKPELQGAEISYDLEPLAAGGRDSIQHWSLIGDGWAGEGRFTLIYGVVKYRDEIGRAHV